MLIDILLLISLPTPSSTPSSHSHHSYCLTSKWTTPSMAATPGLNKVDDDSPRQDEASDDGATMMEADFQIHRNKRKRKKEIRRRNVGTKDSSDEEELTAKDSKKACAGTATDNPNMRRDDGIEAIEDLSAGQAGLKSDTADTAGLGQRTRLLFPSSCNLTFDQKLLWAAKLARKHRSFEALLKTGRNTAYVTVGSSEAVETLTTTGFEDVVLQKPDAADGVKRTKVIIFGFPKVLDPDFLLDDGRFEWARRNSVRGKEKHQLVAMVKGEVMSRVFVPGVGYRRVALFNHYPIMCMKCSRWNHKAWSCQYDERCRFCARGHHSSVCNDKIKAGEKVVRRCCNCRGPHNANYSQCPARPVPVQSAKSDIVPATKYVPAAVPTENVWDARAAASVWPGLGGRDTANVHPPAAPAPAAGASSAASNADIMAVLVDLKKSFQQLSERVGNLEKGLERATKDSSETDVCLSDRRQVQKEKTVAIPKNECVNCMGIGDIEFVDGDDVEDEGGQGDVEISRKFILDMCQEMQRVAEQLMTRVTTDNFVKLSRGSVSHALVRVLGDAKYK